MTDTDYVEVVRVLVYRGQKEWVERSLENRMANGIYKTTYGVIQEAFISKPQGVTIDDK